MKTIKNKLLLLLFTVAFFSCDDILEEDITNDMITATYPVNNEVIESNVVNFQWNRLDGADDYRVQIFSTSQNMILDSLVSTNSFVYNLNPGNYQWRVRGENFAYQTAYTFPFSFSMVETDDLTNQVVQLISPSEGIYTQIITPVFTWSNINAADYYELELVNVTNGNQIIHQESDIDDTSYSLNSGIITLDAQYKWRIKAVNSETESNFSERTFYIDRTAPNQPQNISPQNEASVTVNNPVDFEWSISDDSGAVTSPITYVIEIATNQNFSSIIETSGTSTPDYQYTFTATGNYYWRIKATDLAGNTSANSSYFKITAE